MLDRSGDEGTSVGGFGRVAVSSILIVGARWRVWPSGAGGGGSSGFDVSEDMVAQVYRADLICSQCTGCVGYEGLWWQKPTTQGNCCGHRIAVMFLGRVTGQPLAVPSVRV